MDYHDSLSALLPAPRDDEPAGLRHDIIDELTDHLTCAYHRELLGGTDRAVARARTLQRFGDPAAVARRLWLDAMKGNIMAQRIVIATCLFFMLICIWFVNSISQRSSQSAYELTLANRRVIEYLSQTQATNQEMMRHLQAMDNAAQSRQQLESSTVAFRLTLEMPDGPPAAGFEVRFGRGYGGSSRPDAQNGTSDERGIVVFDVGLPGEWEYTIYRTYSEPQGIVSAPIGGTGGMMAAMGGMSGGEVTWKTQGTIKVQEGGSMVKYIVCPKLPPETSPVKLRVDWPGDLADKNLCVEAQFVYTGINLDTTAPWRIENASRPNFYQTRDILSGPGPRQLEIVAPDQLYLWRFVDGKSSPATKESEGILRPNPVFADFRSETLQSGLNAIEFEDGGYRLARLIIMRPRTPRNAAFKGERFDVIAHAESVSSFALPVYQCEELPDEMSPIGAKSEVDADKKIGRVLLPPSYWLEAEQLENLVKREFEIEAGTVNEWTITVPDELAKVIRVRLNLKEPPEQK